MNPTNQEALNFFIQETGDTNLTLTRIDPTELVAAEFFGGAPNTLYYLGIKGVNVDQGTLDIYFKKTQEGESNILHKDPLPANFEWPNIYCSKLDPFFVDGQILVEGYSYTPS